MKLKSIKANCHELRSANGNSVLFSYETVVAVALNQPIDTALSTYVGVYKTAEKFSKTTSAHVNAWTATTKTLPQSELEALAERAINSRP